MKLTTLRRLACTALACSFITLSLSTPGSKAAPAEKDSILDAMQFELDRSFEKLKKTGEVPVYYLGYRLYDVNSLYISAEYGALTRDAEPDHERLLNVDLRVGSAKVDNTHRRGDGDGFGFRGSSGSARMYVPL